MGSFSIFHWLIIVIIVAAIVMPIVRGVAGPAAKQEHIKVGSKAELFGKVQKYAASGYVTTIDRGNFIVMAKKIPFNWVLGIVLLFIPILGWIALLVLLFSNKNKIRTVTLEAPETI